MNGLKGQQIILETYLKLIAKSFLFLMVLRQIPYHWLHYVSRIIV